MSLAMANVGLAQPAPQMDVMMVLAFLASFLALVCYLHRHRARGWYGGISVCLAVLTVYAFAQNAWPVGLAEGAWAITAFRRMFIPMPLRRIERIWVTQASSFGRVNNRFSAESRISQLFGEV
jgi:hypothetical protein